ncbi:MAG: nitroreductase family protein [Anaerolineae bacterium]|nr:nitroreductase family protein [Anaerolineae bacterium]
MDFMTLIAQRYSVRAYKPDPVEDDKLQQVLEAARLAPTAANRQPFRVIVVHTKGREEALNRIYGRDWFVQPPLVLAVCAVTSEGWVRHFNDGKTYFDVDAAIVMDHMVLAATELGLGTCWIAAFDPDAAREVLQLPGGVEPVVFTPLGYPDVAPGSKKRKPLGLLVHYEKWS